METTGPREIFGEAYMSVREVMSFSIRKFCFLCITWQQSIIWNKVFQELLDSICVK
jgi:hypothetical protein